MATSKFVKYFQTTLQVPLIGAKIWLVPQTDTYPTNALELTAHGTRDGVYYREAVPDGEYKIYIDAAGGTSPDLYEEKIWIGENILTTIRKNFNSSGQLLPAGLHSSLVGAGLTIPTAGAAIHVDYDEATIGMVNGTLGVLPEGIDNNEIADEAISTDKLQDDSVNEFKIADGAVKTAHVYNGAITGPKIADGTFGSGLAVADETKTVSAKVDGETIVLNEFGQIAVASKPEGDGILVSRDGVVGYEDLILNTTYADVAAMAEEQTLTPGQLYRITDFRTRYTQPVSNVDNICDIEPLIVMAVSGAAIAATAWSAMYPEDIVYYTLDNLDGADLGTILRRRNVLLNIDFPRDWRNIEMRRYALDAPAFDDGEEYSFMDIVADVSGYLYISLRDMNSVGTLTDPENWLAIGMQNGDCISPIVGVLPFGNGIATNGDTFTDLPIINLPGTITNIRLDKNPANLADMNIVVGGDNDDVLINATQTTITNVYNSIIIGYQIYCTDLSSCKYDNIINSLVIEDSNDNIEATSTVVMLGSSFMRIKGAAQIVAKSSGYIGIAIDASAIMLPDSTYRVEIGKSVTDIKLCSPSYNVTFKDNVNAVRLYDYQSIINTEFGCGVDLTNIDLSEYELGNSIEKIITYGANIAGEPALLLSYLATSGLVIQEIS